MGAPTDHSTMWTVDLSSGLMSRGDVIIRFRSDAGRGISIDVLASGALTLEQRCQLAGEAIAAIEAKLRVG